MPPERAVGTLTRDILNGIPRRISDKDGHPGDMVNFVIVGSEERLKRAFENGGWVLVDRTKADAVVHTLISTLSKEEYVEMPMSELYLFGRPQDFGFAHAMLMPWWRRDITCAFGSQRAKSEARRCGWARLRTTSDSRRTSGMAASRIR